MSMVVGGSSAREAAPGFGEREYNANLRPLSRTEDGEFLMVEGVEDRK